MSGQSINHRMRGTMGGGEIPRWTVTSVPARASLSFRFWNKPIGSESKLPRSSMLKGRLAEKKSRVKLSLRSIRGIGDTWKQYALSQHRAQQAETRGKIPAGCAASRRLDTSHWSRRRRRPRIHHRSYHPQKRSPAVRKNFLRLHQSQRTPKLTVLPLRAAAAARKGLWD
eukprot:3295214-Rhodomonas_salina.7